MSANSYFDWYKGIDLSNCPAHDLLDPTFKVKNKKKYVTQLFFEDFDICA